MGLGVSLAFISIGAILAFATRFTLTGIDIRMIGWILLLVGLINMAFTLMYTRPRRRARLAQVAEVAEDPVYVVNSDEPVVQVHSDEAAHVHAEDATPHIHPGGTTPHVHTEEPVEQVQPHGRPAQPVPPREQSEPTARHIPHATRRDLSS
ncbi:MAG: hypothetical protein JWO67_5443 [Streptosporangiaceae bacterium]|jgi:hypothetical protein|nr:hypothetical protein [Streptosporangiaceae bacterium]